MNELQTEFQRVFDSCNLDKGRLYADGWPASIAYDVDIAVDVLRQFPDKYGVTEKGDTEVCVALERAGAVEID